MNELEAKRSRLLTWMANQNLEAVFLARVANFAWFTGGLEPVVMLSSDRAEAGLLVTPERSYVVCNTIEHPRLRDEDRLEELGFAFHVSPWYHGAPDFSDLVRGKRWASDWPLPGAEDRSAEIARLRFQLLPEEVERYRRLGHATALAIERAARQLRPGMSEMEIAGRMAAEAMREGTTPTMLLVGTDERIFRYRHPLPTARSLETYALLAICARRWGLVASITRLVHFGPLSAELQAKQAACAYVDATYNLSTVPGASVADIFEKAAQAYAEVGYPEEWKKHNQGGSAGYESRDYEGTPTCPEEVLLMQAFAWNPSITGVKSEDTMLVTPEGPQFLTMSGDWPTVRVTVGDQSLDRPAILIC